MWTRTELKFRAKGILRRSYWWSLLFYIAAQAMYTVVGGISTQIEKIIYYAANIPNVTYQFYNIMARSGMETAEQIERMMDQYLTIWMRYMPVYILVGAILSLVFYTFVYNHINVGIKRFFLDTAKGVMNFNDIGYGFAKNYKGVAKMSFFKTLFIGLGSIVIIPGIIMQYQYILSEYIMAENPDMDGMRALKLSREMVKGHKFNIFVLQLSFIGWYLLGAVACCIGGIFVMPYVMATEAQLYLELRTQAIEKGITTEMELSPNSVVTGW